MAEQQNNQKNIDEWKLKYQSLAETVEAQENYQSLLERSLSRLALAAQGVDTELDKNLYSLRKILKKNHSDRHALTLLLKKLEHLLSNLDDQRASATAIVPLIIDLISQTHWPEKHQAKIQKLLKLCASPTDKNLRRVFTDLQEIIAQSITESTPVERGFFSKLFHSENNKNNLGTESQSDTDSNQEIRKTLSTEPHVVLINLLEKIPLPETLSKKSISLRLGLEAGIDASELPSVINEIADIISQLGSSAIKEKKEYENFLFELTEKITSLDEHLRQLAKDDISVFEHKKQLSDQFEQEMQDIKTDVQNATELNQLKKIVNKRIENLDLHINTYYQSDITRFKQSQEQVEQLNQRLQQLENEAETLRDATKKARELALKDPLTGIWNRQALNEMMDREYNRWQRYNTPLTLAIWDVDLFKKVNDQFGHSAGDLVLKTIAQIFDRATRRSDFIARFGGEEFVGLFPETNIQDSLIMANKIRESIERTPFKYKDMSVPITTSAGIATFEPGDSIDDVFSRADKALYLAKEKGRNNCQICEKTL